MPAKKDKNRNPERRNGKAWKKHPGVSPSAFTGRTQDGYSPTKLRARAAVRTGGKN